MRTLKENAILLVFFLPILHLISPSSQNQTITDALGHTHILGDAPQRIISLAPNITEILFALGLDEEIAGVTRYCNYPRKARTKTRIGGLVDPDLEKIIHLQPDLVIAFRGNPLRMVHRLKDLGLPVFVLDEGMSLESVFALIHKIGRVTGKEKAAEKLTTRLREKLQSIEDRLEKETKRPKVFIDLYGKGLWTFGEKSVLNDLVSKAKGENVAGDIPRSWFNYNREELIHQDPEFIVVISKSEQDFLDVKAWLTEKAHLESIQAVQKGNIYILEEDLIARPGPRLFQALDRLARILHPLVFEEKP